MNTTSTMLAFNRGLISPKALARADLKRTALSAEEMVNWMPRTLGNMMFRPGTRYLHSTKNDALAVHIPFVFSNSDTALLELTSNTMRVMGHNNQILERVAVATAFANGGFDTDLASWSDDDQSGAVSDWLTGGFMRLVGTGVNSARRRQQLTVASGDLGKEHAINLVVTRGTGTLKIGSSAGGAEYRELNFRPGRYSIAVTPTTDLFIELASSTIPPTLVDSISIAPAGPIEITTPWAEDRLQFLRYDQSGDVVFVADGANQPQRIERYGATSWAVVEYRVNDGPFRAINTSRISMRASALTGQTNLTASEAYFRGGHVGALFRLASVGQRVQTNASAENQFTDPIRVTGVGAGRAFFIQRSGTWSGTITLQRSVGAPGDWVNISTYTANGSNNINDGFDNQIMFYRIGFNTGEYTSGTAELLMTFPAGSIEGIGRVVSITSPTVAVVDVVQPFGSLTSTLDWWEGFWSPLRGWPTAVALYDGRLWWAGRDRVFGSVSDAFESFDDGVEGDSGPIARSIGQGPVDTINWLLPLQQLVVGTQSQELVAKSSSLDEPLTPTAFRLLPASTLGSCNRQRAVRIDNTGIFVQCGNASVYELVYDGGQFTYSPRELTIIVPEVAEPSIDRMTVQRRPDTRVHCARGDGKAAVLIFDPAEEVNCWVEIETDGFIEDVVVLPGLGEDRVFYCVRRTINGQTKRYLERFAEESEAVGGETNILTDSTVEFDFGGSPSATITGLGHLEGEEVRVWADGKDAGVFVVASGAVTLPAAVAKGSVGLGYRARFRSAKLTQTLGDGRTSLTQPQRVDHVGLVLRDVHARGLRYGQDFEHLDDMPRRERGAPVHPDAVREVYDEQTLPVNGKWSSDARICLEAESPRPVTVLAAIVEHATNWKR